MKHHLTPEDLEMIIQAIADGDRLAATRIYISITGLTEAQNFIKTLTDELRPTYEPCIPTSFCH